MVFKDELNLDRWRGLEAGKMRSWSRTLGCGFECYESWTLLNYCYAW